MRQLFVYLAGGMGKFGKDEFDKSNTWRVLTKQFLENNDAYNVEVHCTNPNDYFSFASDAKEYESEREVMEFDLNKLRKSDLVVVNFNDMYSLGTMAEIAIAYEKKIPIIGLDVDDQELHPWQKEMTNRIFTNTSELFEYLENFYLI